MFPHFGFSRRLTILLALVLAGNMTAHALAVDRFWSGGTATYNTPANWTGGIVPGGGDNAINDNGSGNVVQVNALDPAWTVNDIRAGTVLGASGAFSQNGPTVTLNAWMRLGTAAGVGPPTGIYTLNSGTLNINAGRLYVGESGNGTAAQNGVGILNINGGTLNKNGGGVFTIGNAGTGTLNMIAGTISATDLIILGDRATGFGGTPTAASGTVFQSGGTITSAGEIWVGQGAQGVGGLAGTYNLSGPATTVLNANNWLAIGRASANGLFTMTGGTINKNATGNITLAGIGTVQTGTLDQSGGIINNTASQTWVGETGIGIYNISGTAVANLGLLELGNNGGANGTVNLNGGGSLSTTQIIKGGGTGTFNFNGGTLQTASSSATFMTGLTTANVRNNGAIIDTVGNSPTIGQSLVHSTIGGDNLTDGGLAKNGGGTLTLSGANTYNGLTQVNGGTLSLSGGAAILDTGAVSLANTAGVTLNLASSETIGSLAGGGGAGGNVTLNANTLTTGGNNTSTTFAGTISGAGGALLKTGSGTMNVTGAMSHTGSTVVRGGALNIAGTSTGGGGIYVVDNNAASTTNAILNISSNVTALQMFIGDRSGSGQAGAVYQTAGTVSLTQAASVDNLRIGSVAGGAGYYKLSGGTLNVNEVGVGGSLNDTVGVMDITGGTFNDAGWITIGRGGATSSGTLNITGGSVALAGTVGGSKIGINWAGTAGAQSVMNVAGATVTGPNNAAYVLDLASANTAGTSGIVNLNAAGTLTIAGVTASNGNPLALLNFNGGTLKATTTNNGAAYMTSGNIDGAYIYSGGATVDDSGTAITISTPLLSTAGTGVTNIAVTNGGSGYVGAPLIKITGGTGSGATAVANMVDDGTGNGTFKISSITITSAGVYSAAPTTVTPSGGGSSSAVLGAITTGANNTTGGLTKTGAGTLTLTGGTTGSTFAGNIVVNQGALTAATLNLNNSGTSGPLGNSQVAGRTITVNNGSTLNFNVGNVLGTGSTTTLTNLVINAGGGKFVLNANDANIIGNITLNGATITTGNSYAVGAAYHALILTGGGSGATPGLVTVTGSSPSIINTTGSTANSNGVMLGAQGSTGGVNFDVADVTSNPNADLTISAPLVGTPTGGAPTGGALIKSGAGTLVLRGESSFSGNITVNLGTLTADTVNLNNTGTTGPLGNSQVAGRTITVNNGSTLNFNVGNVLGTGSTTTQTSVIVNAGGNFNLNANDANIVGNVTLNGATITTGNSYAPGAAYYALILTGGGAGATPGTFTVGGTAASTINTTGSVANSNGIMLGAQGSTGGVNFIVADATSDANPDLIVNVPLVGTPTGGVPTGGVLTKTGAGTMRLNAVNTYGGNTVANGGILEISATGSITQSNEIWAAQGASGRIDVNGGSIASPNYIVAGRQDGTGTINLNTGTANTPIVTIGALRPTGVNSTIGTFNVGGGASAATLTVTNELWIAEAAGGGANPTTGTLNLFNNGVVNVTNFTRVGYHNAANGTLAVSGGVLTTKDLIVANDTGATGTVNQSGGTINVTALTTYRVGNNGSGVVDSAGTGIVNHSSGLANVTGNMVLGDNPTAGPVVNFYNLSNAGDLNFGDSTGVSAHHQVTPLSPSTITINSDAAFNFTGGTLRDVSTIVTNSAAGVGTGLFTQNGGTFIIGQDETSPSAFARTTNLNGGFSLMGGVLKFDIFGKDVTPKNYSDTEVSDILKVSGNAFLNSTVDVDINYGAAFGDVMAVLTSPKITLGSGFTMTDAFFRVVEQDGANPGDPKLFALEALVPEPASIAVWTIIGLAGAAAAARFRRRRK